MIIANSMTSEAYVPICDETVLRAKCHLRHATRNLALFGISMSCELDQYLRLVWDQLPNSFFFLPVRAEQNATVDLAVSVQLIDLKYELQPNRLSVQRLFCFQKCRCAWTTLNFAMATVPNDHRSRLCSLFDTRERSINASPTLRRRRCF